MGERIGHRTQHARARVPGGSRTRGRRSAARRRSARRGGPPLLQGGVHEACDLRAICLYYPLDLRAVSAQRGDLLQERAPLRDVVSLVELEAARLEARLLLVGLRLNAVSGG